MSTLVERFHCVLYSVYYYMSQYYYAKAFQLSYSLMYSISSLAWGAKLSRVLFSRFKETHENFLPAKISFYMYMSLGITMTL